jgi:hypothetical protein
LKVSDVTVEKAGIVPHGTQTVVVHVPEMEVLIVDAAISIPKN